MWAEANTTRFSTLIYKSGEEKPQRDMGASMPTAELQVTNVLDGDMMDSIGIQPSALGQTSDEVSGKAIQARQSEADVGTFEFIDNYQNAIRRVGLLCVEMIPKIYDTERIIRIRGADGSTDTVTINQEIEDENGESIVINDLNFGKHTVVMSSGASYETKREENADQILGLMQTNPQIAQVGSDLLVKNLDFSESDVLAQRLEKTVPMHLLSKEKQEELQKDMPEPQPSPEQIQAQSEMEQSQLDAEMKKLELDSKVQIESIKLETAQTNLAIKQLELEDKAKEEGRTLVNNEDKRRDEVAKAIIEDRT